MTANNPIDGPSVHGERTEQPATGQTAPETVEGAVRPAPAASGAGAETDAVTTPPPEWSEHYELGTCARNESCRWCMSDVLEVTSDRPGYFYVLHKLQRTAADLRAATARADRAEEALRDVLVGCETMLHSGPNLKYRQWFETYSKFISAALRSSASPAAATEEGDTDGTR